MSNKRRRQTKKKHEVPLTEDMLNELNKASFGHQGGYGYHQGYAGYDNYGQDPDEFYDMEDVWSNDNKYYGQQRYKVNILFRFSRSLKKHAISAPFQYDGTRNSQQRSRQSAAAWIQIQSLPITVVRFLADGVGRVLRPVPIGSLRSFQFRRGCESQWRRPVSLHDQRRSASLLRGWFLIPVVTFAPPRQIHSVQKDKKKLKTFSAKWNPFWNEKNTLCDIKKFKSSWTNWMKWVWIKSESETNVKRQRIWWNTNTCYFLSFF